MVSGQILLYVLHRSYCTCLVTRTRFQKDECHALTLVSHLADILGVCGVGQNDDSVGILCVCII